MYTYEYVSRGRPRNDAGHRPQGRDLSCCTILDYTILCYTILTICYLLFTILVELLGGQSLIGGADGAAKLCSGMGGVIRLETLIELEFLTLSFSSLSFY